MKTDNMKKIMEDCRKKKSSVRVAHRGVGEGGEPIPTEIIAEDICTIAEGMRAIRKGRLNEKALIVLLCHDTDLGVGTIKTVLASLDGLEDTYLKKKA